MSNLKISQSRFVKEGSLKIGGVMFGVVTSPHHDPYFGMVYTTRKPKYAKKPQKPS